jgi:hypothetical protein
MRSSEYEPNIPSLIGTIAAAATTGVMIRSFDRAVRTATGAAIAGAVGAVAVMRTVPAFMPGLAGAQSAAASRI